jgi:transcription factor E
MKITSKIVEEIVSEVAGSDVMPLVKALRNKKNVSEFKLADSIKREINLTRNMLYRLYDNNLVSFVRKKDKKKGWYIYYWTFNQKRVKDLAFGVKKGRHERLTERLNRENSTQFYICSNQCMRLDFEQAHDFKFKCPECGLLVDLEDNSKKIKELQKDLEKVEKELKEMAKPAPKPARRVVKKAVKKPAKKKVKKKVMKKKDVKKVKKKAVKKKKRRKSRR